MNACYMVSRTMILSHAAAWHVYDAKYRAKQNGMISITLNSDWAEPKDATKPEDITAAKTYLEVGMILSFKLVVKGYCLVNFCTVHIRMVCKPNIWRW